MAINPDSGAPILVYLEPRTFFALSLIPSNNSPEPCVNLAQLMLCFREATDMVKSAANKAVREQTDRQPLGSAGHLVCRHQHIFYGHKVMDQLRILARLARPCVPQVEKSPSRRVSATAP